MYNYVESQKTRNFQHTYKIGSMRGKVIFSAFAIVLTSLVMGVLFVGCIATVGNDAKFFTLLFIYIMLILITLLYGPAYVQADEEYVILGSILKKHRIPMRNVESVELFQPTMGAIRIFASGGFLGYWGMYREGDIGRYYAFYGKASDCFLIRMKNGDKYVAGCENPDAMVKYISGHVRDAGRAQ